MSLNRIVDDDIVTVLKRLEEKILFEINCVAIGKIDKVHYGEQTVEALIVYKHVVRTGEIKDYPLLLDVPFFVLQGGISYLEMPITQGDYCILLFNDRNFSTWWDSEDEKEPESLRKHSLSDGIALVGINPKTKVFDIDGEKTRLHTDKKLVLDADGSVSLLSNKTELVEIGNSVALLGKIWNDTMDALTALHTEGSPGAHTGGDMGRRENNAVENDYRTSI